MKKSNRKQSRSRKVEQRQYIAKWEGPCAHTGEGEYTSKTLCLYDSQTLKPVVATDFDYKFKGQVPNPYPQEYWPEVVTLEETMDQKMIFFEEDEVHKINTRSKMMHPETGEVLNDNTFPMVKEIYEGKQLVKVVPCDSDGNPLFDPDGDELTTVEVSAA